MQRGGWYLSICSLYVLLGRRGEGMLGTMAAVKRLELTAELFGKLFALVWAEKFGRSMLPSRAEITKLLIGSGDDIPESIEDIMHQDERLGTRTIAEFTDYILAAQEAGLVQRMNPSFVSGAVQIGSFDARKLLSMFEDDLKQEIDWLRSRINRMVPIPAQPQ